MSPSGLGNFDEEGVHTKVMEVDGLKMRLLSIERIIKSKEAAGRQKDKQALPILYATLAALKA
jgi:hypothetical protein